MPNKAGYTLIEMLLVILIISISLSCFTYVDKWQNKRLKVILVKDYLSYAQSLAIKEKRNINVSLANDTLIIDHNRYIIDDLGVYPYDYYYNELGNVSKAGTIKFKNNSSQIVLNVGSGCLELK